MRQCFYFVEVEDNFYEQAISILLEANEAAVVRENAAQLLANLAGMAAPCGNEKILPVNVAVLKKVGNSFQYYLRQSELKKFLIILFFIFQSFTLKLITLFEENRFFCNLESIIEYLFTLRIPDVGKPLESKTDLESVCYLKIYFNIFHRNEVDKRDVESFEFLINRIRKISTSHYTWSHQGLS